MTDYAALGQLDFDESWMTRKEGVSKVNDALFATKNILDRIGGGSVLDAGCFNGYLYNWLSECCNVPFKYTGIDINPEAIEYAKNFNHGVRYEERDLFSLSGEKYDVVCCFRVLIHIDEWEAALAALVTVAKIAVVLVVRIEDKDVDRYHEDILHRAFSMKTIKTAAENLGCRVDVKKTTRQNYQPIVLYVGSE